MEVFANVFEEFYIFVVIMGPSESHFWHLVFQTISVELKIKIHRNERMASKLKVLLNNYAK